jgi:hypothetical protein
MLKTYDFFQIAFISINTSEKILSFDFRCLKINQMAEEVSSVGFSALATLPQLRIFKFFYFREKWAMEQKCFRLCAEFLPHLRMVGYSPDDGDFCWLLEYEDSDGAYHNPLVKREQSAQLALEELMLVGEVQPNQFCQLPHLKTALLFRPKGDVLGLFHRFHTIVDLQLFNRSER